MTELLFQEVPIDEAYETPLNNRRTFNAAALAELTESVRTKGILTPLVMRRQPKGDDPSRGFEILAGARRYRAALAAGLLVLPARIGDFTDGEALEIVVIENLQREDLHPLEEAEGYRSLLDQPGYDVALIAAKVHKSESYVHQRIKLTDTVEPVREAFRADRLTLGHVLLIARLQPVDQEAALALAFRQDYSGGTAAQVAVRVSELAERIEEELLLSLSKATFDPTDANLLPEAGSCTVCPKRTGATPSLFGDIAKGDTCTHGACFKAKIAAHLAAKAAELAESGPEPLRLSTEHFIKGGNKDGLVTARKWTKVKPKACASAQRGLIVHTGGYGEFKLGQVLTVCADEDCKTHRRKTSNRHGSTDGRAQQREDARRAKGRAERERRCAINARLFAAIAERAPKKLGKPELVKIVQQLRFDGREAEYLAPLVGIAVPSNLGPNDWAGHEKLARSIDQRLPQLTEAELSRVLSVAHLADKIDSFRDEPDIANAAREAGIDVKAITKAVDAEIAAAATPVAESTTGSAAKAASVKKSRRTKKKAKFKKA